MERLYNIFRASRITSLLLLPVLFLAGCASVDPTWQTLGERERAPKSVTIPAGGVRIPLVRCEQGHLFVEARCRGTPLFLLLDTGSPRLQLPLSFAREQGIVTLPVEHQTWTEGQSPLEVGLLPELRFGSVCVKEVPVSFTDLSGWISEERRFARQRVDGVLGEDLLSALNARIEYADGRLILLAKPP